MLQLDELCRIRSDLDSRSISFENPTGARGKGGLSALGRKGTPNKVLAPGEKIVLADIDGPGRIRHIWLTFNPDGAPEEMRAVWMEAFYDGNKEPSISVPCLDFFGLPHGRPTAYFSAVTAAQEGRGFNAYFPMPFGKHVRIELTNSGTLPIIFCYQIDYTLEKIANDDGYLHVSFRRENPTTLKRDFVIAKDLRGPGRFFGVVIGIRPLEDGMCWYGEGEFKIYRDGDGDFPTLCGTGLEDYVGSAWAMGRHTSLYAGVPLCIKEAKQTASSARLLPDFVGFYRWHICDPIVFSESLTAVIQQIGWLSLEDGPDAKQQLAKFTPAGWGWELEPGKAPSMEAQAQLMRPESKDYASKLYAFGLAERVDDYSAAAFVYCREPQAVPRLDIKQAIADIGLLDYEKSSGASQ